LGLAFPFEVLLFLGGCVAAIQWLPAAFAILGSVALYALIRVASYGRPPMFFQHWLAWKWRLLKAFPES